MKVVHPDGRTQDGVTVAEFFRTFGPAGFVPVEDATGNAAADDVVMALDGEGGNHTDAIVSAPDRPERTENKDAAREVRRTVTRAVKAKADKDA
jgi:hypothetical protein